MVSLVVRWVGRVIQRWIDGWLDGRADGSIDEWGGGGEAMRGSTDRLIDR